MLFKTSPSWGLRWENVIKTFDCDD